MTLHLAGIADSIIKIIDRWRSDAFLIYLQGQITNVTQGVYMAISLVQWITHTNVP